MSVQAITSALAIQGVTPSEKLLLLALANYANEQMQCFPSQKRLAADTCLSDRTIRTLLAALEERSFLTRSERTRSDGSRSTDLITLHFNEVAVSGGAEATSGGAEMISGGVRKQLPGGAEMVSALTTFEPSLNRQSEPPASATADPKSYPDDFEAAWKAYPHVKGRSSKVKAHDFWRKLGASQRAGLAAAAERYAREGREPRMDCGAQAMERWIRDQKFADWLAEPKPTATVTELDPWPGRLREYRRNAYWNTTDWGPKPGKPGCRVPAEYLDQAA